MRYTSTADAATAEALLAPLRAVAPVILDGVAELPYAAIGAVHADPVDPMPSVESSGLLRTLTAEAVDALLAVAGPGSNSPQVVVELRRLGGALARKPLHDSAFDHRDAAYSVLAVGVLAPPVAAIVPAHGASVVAALDEWSTGGLLPNFGASSDPAVIARQYSEDTRVWLAALAEQHDPAGVLRTGPPDRSGS